MVGKMNENKCIEEFVLVSKAPVETAVKLSKHFRVLAIKEKVNFTMQKYFASYCFSAVFYPTPVHRRGILELSLSVHLSFRPCVCPSEAILQKLLDAFS